MLPQGRPWLSDMSLQVLENIGCTPVIVESDSLELSMIATEGLNYGALILLLYLITSKYLIGLVLSLFFHHCLREANKAANNLVTLGYNLFLLDGDPTIVLKTGPVSEPVR
jgi:hypothetical protein